MQKNRNCQWKPESEKLSRTVLEDAEKRSNDVRNQRKIAESVAKDTFKDWVEVKPTILI